MRVTVDLFAISISVCGKDNKLLHLTDDIAALAGFEAFNLAFVAAPILRPDVVIDAPRVRIFLVVLMRMRPILFSLRNPVNSDFNLWWKLNLRPKLIGV